MDLGPITGIRSISLLNAQKTKAEESPRFEIDASARSDEEGYSPSQEQTPDRKPPQQEASQPDPIPAEKHPEESSNASEGNHNWFV